METRGDREHGGGFYAPGCRTRTSEHSVSRPATFQDWSTGGGARCFGPVSYTMSTVSNQTGKACGKPNSKRVTKALKTDAQTSGLAAAKKGGRIARFRWPDDIGMTGRMLRNTQRLQCKPELVSLRSRTTCLPPTVRASAANKRRPDRRRMTVRSKSTFPTTSQTVFSDRNWVNTLPDQGFLAYMQYYGRLKAFND